MTGSRTPAWLRALRPKQWTKNGVVLAPFVFALGDATQQVGLAGLWQVLGAAALFCLASSAIYLLNDLHDAEMDRMHPVKRFRPIAAREISPRRAVTLSAALLAAALGLAFALRPQLGSVLLAYAALQILYTFGLRGVALLDLFVIAAGFVLRALAGAVVLHVRISPWLLLCTMLLALFLALCKRRHEKVVVEPSQSGTRPSLDHYDVKLLDQLIAVVCASTLVCYALYTLWPDTVDRFGTHALGFTIPFVVFGLFRYLDLVYRHEKGGRPEQILLTDLPLLIDIAAYGVCVLGVVLFA